MFRYQCPIRTRYNEGDPQGIIFNGNFWIYIDVAFTDYLRDVGEAGGSGPMDGGHVVAAESKIRYLASAKPLERLQVGVRCAHIGRSSLVFEYQIHRPADDVTLALAQVAYVHVDAATLTRADVPADWRAAIVAYEGGTLTPPTPITRLLDSHAAGGPSTVNR